MHILMVGSEATPFAKTGGLADVLGALPRALARLGHDVDVVIPRYRGITAGDRTGTVTVSSGGPPVETDTYEVRAGRVRTVFIDRPEYFDRPHLYGPIDGDYADNPARFAFLSNAALAWAGHQTRVDVVHVHDWQTGLVPLLLRQGRGRHPSLATASTVCTIHNLAYQGVFDAGWLPRLGLDRALLHPDTLEYWGRISLLKAGLTFSRMITTVSPQYAREIQTPELGFGFDGLLRARASDLVGILNGIDYDEWNPARDPCLPEPFDASSLGGKASAKRALLEHFGMAPTEAVRARPLVGMVSRLVDQKGFDLLASLADELPHVDATLVLLGSGEARYEELWRALAERYPDRIGVRIGFDEGLAHLIEGGADVFLMPSRFEPCGLNQMYSQHYGTVPVVRATGGLVDTVQDFNLETGEGTGFTFTEPSPGALLRALRRALSTFRDRVTWGRIQRAGMARDFSWDGAARRYVEVYERALAEPERFGSDPPAGRNVGQ